MSDQLTSYIRTAVPFIIGAIVAWLTKKGVHVSDASVASATALLTFVFGMVYYVVVRWLEVRYPKLGVLLGVPSKPTYAPAAPEAK
jgi:hypothetical protein